MRALWTAASGMKSQQLNVDTISNNIANINTVGYKKTRAEFKDMLYTNLGRVSIDSGNGPKGSFLQVGHGVRPSAMSRFFDNGALMRTENALDFGVEGPGFFSVQLEDGSTAYTRDGAFAVSTNNDGSIGLVNGQGYPVLGKDGQPITFPAGTNINNITVDEEGKITIMQNSVPHPLGQLSITQFDNPPGLNALGNNLYQVTDAAGNQFESTTTRVVQGYLETSNVDMASEMTNLIIAQRAYDMSSKAITNADKMMEMANNLRR